MIEKNKALPLLAGAAINDEAREIYERLGEYFANGQNAPSADENNQDSICSTLFVNNTHFYFKDVNSVKDMPMQEKDRKGLEIVGIPIRSILYILISDKDKPIGLLQLFSFKKVIELDEEDIEVISHLCSLIPSILRNSKLHSQLEQKSALLEQKNNQLQDELHLASQIQQNFIPQTPPEIQGLELGSLYKPMIQVGGDFYDFIRLSEHQLGIFISDVSGHGVAAALITSMIKVLLETAGELLFSPARLLSYVNRKIIGQTAGNFLTAFYGVYNSRSQIFSYARGAHSFPFLIRNKTLSCLESRGKMLGIMEDCIFEEKEIQLEPGDRVLFFYRWINGSRKPRR